jgi:hypothetical protein
LVLTQTRGSYAALQVIFGITASNILKWLYFSKRVLLLALLRIEGAKIKMPTIQQVRVFKEVIWAMYPSLVHCWGALNGVKIGIQKPSDDMKQSHFYNGWTHAHYVAKLFIFTPDGCNCASCVKSHGNMSKIFHMIDDMYDLMDGLTKVVVDSAFASEARDSLIKSYQTNQGRNGQFRQDERVNNEAAAIRQMAEWGMQAFQGSFPRLKEKIRFEERGERKIRLNLMVLLYNFRASKVGQNQIQNIYLPFLNQNALNYIR